VNIAVSACLLGQNCKYNGSHNFSEQVAALKQKHNLIPVCPEMLGGLGCPRTPCEIRDGKVIDRNGTDRTEAFESGADKAIAILKEKGALAAIVQPRSPSCGSGCIYDGTFSGNLVPGDGIFVQKLKNEGIHVINADHSLSCDPFLNALK
jgi:uncharacterized protein YbbK (DUF523 family)